MPPEIKQFLTSRDVYYFQPKPPIKTAHYL
ncbi:MAG: hypothetical protein RIR39_346 [Pseudomonadota bacterium]